jgi:hypothetical protein
MKRSWPNLRHYLGISLEGLRKTINILGQDSRSPGRDLSQGPPEYETEMLATRPRRSVYLYNKQMLEAWFIGWLVSVHLLSKESEPYRILFTNMCLLL